jgi:hypothetical protein
MSACLNTFECVAGGGASSILSAWPGRLAQRKARSTCRETAGNQQAANQVPQGIQGGQKQDSGSGGGHHGTVTLVSIGDLERSLG